jgi:hypothetical protein
MCGDGGRGLGDGSSGRERADVPQRLKPPFELVLDAALEALLHPKSHPAARLEAAPFQNGIRDEPRS